MQKIQRFMFSEGILIGLVIGAWAFRDSYSAKGFIFLLKRKTNNRNLKAGWHFLSSGMSHGAIASF